MTVAEKWLTMMLLCLSGSTIYWMPYFSDIYYVPMQDAFGFSNTQLGVLSSTFGITSLIGYFPGGWLADRFSSRKLMSVALVITAAGAFVFSTMPSFEVCVLLFGLWGITTACVFWSAIIKATRNWGSSDEQGRAFGMLEGGRKIVDTASATLLPGGPSLVPLLMINGAVISCAVYGLRGIYFALLEQGGIPIAIAITGTATGVVSVIGYTPDIFLPVLGGMILDASPGARGYQNLFLFVAALNFLGLVAAYVTYRKIQVDRAAGAF